MRTTAVLSSALIAPALVYATPLWLSWFEESECTPIAGTDEYDCPSPKPYAYVPLRGNNVSNQICYMKDSAPCPRKLQGLVEGNGTLVGCASLAFEVLGDGTTFSKVKTVGDGPPLPAVVQKFGAFYKASADGCTFMYSKQKPALPHRPLAQPGFTAYGYVDFFDGACDGVSAARVPLLGRAGNFRFAGLEGATSCSEALFGLTAPPESRSSPATTLRTSAPGVCGFVAGGSEQEYGSCLTTSTLIPGCQYEFTTPNPDAGTTSCEDLSGTGDRGLAIGLGVTGAVFVFAALVYFCQTAKRERNDPSDAVRLEEV